MVQVDKKICPHDHICPLIKICPVGAISQDSEGFPVIDYNLCIECGKCVRKCPMKAMKKVENKTGNTNFIKIALPVKDGMIDNHFGHCENFAISSISDGQIESVEIMSVQEDC